MASRFSIPGNVSDSASEELGDEWHAAVSAIFAKQGEFEQLYDPTDQETPADSLLHRISWHAFPVSLNRKTASAAARAELADGDREKQDEYCEWSVEREGDEITKITFTTEVREYYSTLAAVDSDALLELYREFVSSEVQLDDLLTDGSYDPLNQWNSRVDGPIMHLCQTNNNLEAAAVLVAEATVQRQRNGVPVTNQQDLVVCGGLGNPFRNSDPQIAAAVNGLAATGARLTLEDPVGLYLDRLETAGIGFPEGVDPSDCWIVERGDADHVVRARFQLPTGAGPMSEVTVNGASVHSGAQLADRVVVRIGAISHSSGSQDPRVEDCES